MSKIKSKNFKLLSLLMAIFLSFGTFNSVKAQDVGVTALVVPYDTICGSTNWPILVSLKNYNIGQIDFSIDNVTVTVTISGASTQTFSFIVNSGILSGYASQNVTVTNLADMSAGGTHIFNASATIIGDINNTNDAMAAANVFVKPTPTVNGEPNPSVCAGTVMPAFNYISNPPGATFTWSNDNTLIGLAASGAGDRPSFIPVNNGGSPVNANITVQGTLDGCLGGSLGYLIQVNPLPTVNAGNNLTVCAGTSVTFSPSSTGAVAYFWDFGDGGTSTVLNPVHAYSIPGTYNAIFTATNSYGCNASDTMQIIINPNPVLTPTSSPSTCGNSNGSAAVSVTGGSAPYSFYWTPSGSTTSFITNITAGTYNVTVTDINGCTASTNSIVSDIAGPTISSIPYSAPTCNGFSNGTATVIVSGGQPSYTYSWTGSGSQTTQTATALPAGVYTVMVTDQNNCIATGSVIITEPSLVQVFTNSADTICFGQTSQIYAAASGGTPAYTYSWNDGSTNFNTTAGPIVVNPLTNTYYTVTVTDANGCVVNTNTTVTVSPYTSINGHVNYSGGNLSSGVNKAILFKSVSILVSFDTIAITTLDGLGNYNFTSVPPDDYLIKIFPDTSVYHTAIVPTYYGNMYLWDSASVVTHGCGVSSVANITMVENVSGVGPGFISGQIFEGPGFGRAPGDPVPGIDIKLGRNPGGQLFSNTQTDAGGNYSFSNLPIDSYIIFVDIPGLGRDSTYIVNVTSTDDHFNNLNYTVDSTLIHPNLNTIGIRDITNKESNFNIYPNPSKGNATIEYSITGDSEISLSIYNVLGVKVAELVNGHQSEGTYKINIQESNKLRSGIYFTTLLKDGKAATKRLIITE